MPDSHESKYIDKSFTKGSLKLEGNPHGEFIELRLVQEMQRCGVDPAVIYAYEKTLLWITNENVKDFLGRPAFSEKELAAWDAALEEYNKQQGDTPS